MRRLSKVLSFFAAWTLVIAMLLGAVFAVAFTPAIYFFEYQKHGQALVIGCDEATLQTLTVALIDYMKGERDNLDLPVVINMQTREAFSIKEKTHMHDVRGLINSARYAAAMGLVAFAVLLSAAMLLCPAGERGRSVAGGMLWGILAMMVAVLAAAAYFAMDFNAAWNRFHTIFFTNDLWQLNPATDVLLMMMPLAFFVDMVSFVGIIFGAGLLVLTLVLAIVRLRAGSVPPVDFAQEEDGEVTAYLEAVQAPDGERFVLPQEGKTQRPPAEEIFEQFGLSDADDGPLLPDEEGLWNEEKPRKPQGLELAPQAPPAEPETAPEPEPKAVEPVAQAPVAARTVKRGDNTLAVSVPVTIPASALDITRLQDGIKLELKLELFLRDGDALLGAGIPQAPATEDPATDEPTLSELMSRVDEIMAGLPGEGEAAAPEGPAPEAAPETQDDVIGHMDDLMAALPDEEDTP